MANTKKILVVVGILVALRFVFPVMHVVTNYGTEPCISRVYPVTWLLNESCERYASAGYFRPDFSRTIFEALALVVLGVVWWLVGRRKESQPNKKGGGGGEESFEELAKKLSTGKFYISTNYPSMRKKKEGEKDKI